MSVPVVLARGGAEVALDLIIRFFPSIELACAVRRACLLCVNLLHCCCPRTWPACDHVAMQHQSEHFLHTSHCTLHTLHFTLHTCTSHSTDHLISNHLISFRLMSPHLTFSHLIPSLLTCHLSKFFSTIFTSSEHWIKGPDNPTSRTQSCSGTGKAG